MIDIIKQHLDSYKSIHKKTDYRPWTLTKLVYFPALTAILIYFFSDSNVDAKVYEKIFGFVSFTGGFLFAVLAVLYELVKDKKQEVKRGEEGDSDADERKSVVWYLGVVHSNVSFAILLSIVVVVTVVIKDLLGTKLCLLNKVLGVLALYLFFLYIITLFVCVKRIHFILSYHIQPEE